ncbi:MAG TPA: hypothetical protein VFX05_03740 [Casimicrobiaceae bacterium]|nr:hypothetical protein [Casimicrobiaceae bacterium]
MKKWMVNVLAGAALAAAAGSAAAQQCVNFGDVQDDGPNGFCPTVEWIKNRGITTGCAGGANYCPNDAVSRLAMAAFMQRLGRALTPEVLFAQGAIDTSTPIPNELPDPAIVTCNTTVAAAANYPRKAVLTAMFSGLANASPATFRAFLLMNPDGNGYQSLTPGVSAAARATLPASGWGTVALTELVALNPGETYQFAIGVRRDNLLPAGGTLERFRCQLTVTIMNRNGTTSPL